MRFEVILTCETKYRKFIEAESKEEVKRLAREWEKSGIQNPDGECDGSYIDVDLYNGTQIETSYCPSSDTTFITKIIYKDGELIARQVTGFYSGEPNEDSTRIYDGELTAYLL